MAFRGTGLLTYRILRRQPLLKVIRLAAENVAMHSPGFIAAFDQDIPLVLGFPQPVEPLAGALAYVACMLDYHLRDVASIVGSNHGTDALLSLPGHLKSLLFAHNCVLNGELDKVIA